jgi:hypothetical protein
MGPSLKYTPANMYTVYLYIYIFYVLQFLDKLGLEVIEERINGVDHFDIVENLSNKDYSLTKTIINFILN